MRMQRRDQASIDARNERNRRDDAATRLCDEVPSLRTLRIRFEDRRGADQVNSMSYAKVVVIASAPATFDIRCTEPRCDGWHDLTSHMLSSLRRKLTTFGAESACSGIVGEIGCNHVLVYTCDATYAI